MRCSDDTGSGYTPRLRAHGSPPYTVAVVHGGPGAGGEMAPVARRLAERRGVLEPIQTALSLDGQVEELRHALVAYGGGPFTLIGYSWGAWLVYILTARHPDLVNKVVLVSSGPFEDHYVAQLGATRMSRLDEAERREFGEIIEALSDPDAPGKDARLARLGFLAAKTDAYDLLPEEPDADGRLAPNGDVFQSVWREGAEMRRNGALLALSEQIRCPVVAIHGDYDPHPAEGVRIPLAARLPDFRFVLLRGCGHTPWRERQAQEGFYEILGHLVESV